MVRARKSQNRAVPPSSFPPSDPHLSKKKKKPNDPHARWRLGSSRRLLTAVSSPCSSRPPAPLRHCCSPAPAPPSPDLPAPAWSMSQAPARHSWMAAAAAAVDTDGDHVIEVVSAGSLYRGEEWERKYWSSSRVWSFRLTCSSSTNFVDVLAHSLGLLPQYLAFLGQVVVARRLEVWTVARLEIAR